MIIGKLEVQFNKKTTFRKSWVREAAKASLDLITAQRSDEDKTWRDYEETKKCF